MKESTSIVSIIADIEKNVVHVWGNETKFSVNDLVKEAEQFEKKCLKIGAIACENMTEVPSFEEQYLGYQIVFEWLETAKHFMIAWRNVIFEQYKGIILLNDKRTNQSSLNEFRWQSQLVMEAAKNELTGQLNSYLLKDAFSITSQQKLKKWANLKNPYSIYQRQIHELVEQCKWCDANLQTLMKEQTIFYEIEVLIEHNIQEIQDQVQQLEDILKQLVKDLKKEDLTVENQMLIVEKAELSMNSQNIQTDFNKNLTAYFEQLIVKMDLAVGVQNGLITKREINLQRLAKRWILSEIEPLLYEIWEIRDSLTGGAMILINLKNQLKIKIAQHDILQTSETVNVSIAFLDQLSQRMTVLNELKEKIENRLAAQFKLSNVFDLHHAFLHTTAQASINELLGKQTNYVSVIQKWWVKQRKKVRAYQSSLAEGSALSVSEKVVSYINHKKGKSENEYYQNIFLTKGYIGEAFWVGKEADIRRVRQVVENWKSGYRGAILLTGKRMSGKSLFGEIVLNRYFTNQTIHLFPNSTVSINNKKVKTVYNLGKTLKEIKRHTQNKPFAIWIDNLEMWWDRNTSLSKNIRNLKQFIDTYGHELFFIVAMSDTFKTHISASQEIDKVFQAEIEMVDFPLKDLEKAISVRHGATHKMLVNARKEPQLKQNFKKIVKQIHQVSNGNLGEALYLWANAIEAKEDDTVYCNFKGSLDFPNILNSSTATLLTSIVLQKRTNEHRLEYLFGSAYREKYASLVNRLLGVGILTKKIDGWLEINELVVHEVIEILKKKKYLF